MTIQRSRGTEGEQIAADYLQKQGYTILERNWRWKKYEIDLIVEKGGILAFVEVKSRGEDPLDDPVEAVNRKKQKHMVLAAERYMEKVTRDVEVRYDIIIVLFTRQGVKIDHIPEAFYPTPI
jgi:putative endonuclease